MTRLPLVIGLALLHAATLAAAQTVAPTPQTHPDETLRGPVVHQAGPDTLVIYEYSGELQELGLPPAEAALELLDLDDQTAGRVGRILNERAMLAERLIIENFDLVSQGETVQSSGTALEKGLFFVQVLRVLQPLTERGPLEDEIRAVLPEPAAERYDMLLDEYWQAVGKARVAQARTRGEKLRLRKAIREARRDQLGQEVKLAAQRAIESEEFTVGYLTRGLDLTDYQQARIKRLVIDFAARTMGEASQQDKERLVAGVLAYLDEHQRDMLIERIKGL